MEVTTCCTVDGCRERITVIGPFIAEFARGVERVMREEGWKIVRDKEGKRHSFCLEHAESPEEEE